MSMTGEEAIRRIQSHMRNHHIGEYPHIYIKEALDMAIDALREQEGNRWIPVTERMPEKEGSYLIFTTVYFTPDHVDECDHYDGITISGYHPEYGFMGNGGLFAKAWMPLPEPPKEA
jgi:hypothetical protein